MTQLNSPNKSSLRLKAELDRLETFVAEWGQVHIPNVRRHGYVARNVKTVLASACAGPI